MRRRDARARRARGARAAGRRSARARPRPRDRDPHPRRRAGRARPRSRRWRDGPRPAASRRGSAARLRFPAPEQAVIAALPEPQPAVRAPDLPLLDEGAPHGCAFRAGAAVVAALPEPAPVVATVHPPPRPASAELTALPQNRSGGRRGLRGPADHGRGGRRGSGRRRARTICAPRGRRLRRSRPSLRARRRSRSRAPSCLSMSADPVAGREAARVLPTRPTKPPLALPFGLRP